MIMYRLEWIDKNMHGIKDTDCRKIKQTPWLVFSFTIYFDYIDLFKEYLKCLNRLYDITWFGSVYAAVLWKA